MSLYEFLVWLVSGGSIVAVSWLCERWAWFQKQTPDVKEYFVYGMSVALSISAYCVNTFVDPAILEKLAPIFAIASATFISIFIGKLFHKVDRFKSAQG